MDGVHHDARALYHEGMGRDLRGDRHDDQGEDHNGSQYGEYLRVRGDRHGAHLHDGHHLRDDRHVHEMNLRQHPQKKWPGSMEGETPPKERLAQCFTSEGRT